MTPLLASVNWRMTFAFAAGMSALILCLKIVSALQGRSAPGFWLTLLPSPDSMSRARAASGSDAAKAIRRLALALIGFAALWFFCVAVARTGGLATLWLGWLAAPMVWLMGEGIGALMQLVWLPSGRLLPAPHCNIFAARSVSDFWGRRWNVWMSDWFRHALFIPLQRQPTLAMLVVFAVSGLIHELVINLPLWLIAGRNLFGTLMAYFGLQAAGFLIERRWLAECPRLKRVFTWLVVFGPAPLFVNEGVLRAYHLWP